MEPKILGYSFVQAVHKERATLKTLAQ
ncbi:unnamed protein product, partial [Rotaria magnacalcarata]